MFVLFLLQGPPGTGPEAKVEASSEREKRSDRLLFFSFPPPLPPESSPGAGLLKENLSFFFMESLRLGISSNFYTERGAACGVSTGPFFAVEW